MRPLKDIGRGLAAYSEAFRLIRSLELYKYMAIPLGISLTVTLVIGLLAKQIKSLVTAYFKGFWPWEFGADFMAQLSGVLSSLGVLFLGFILTKYLVLALSAPFMSGVADRIRMHYAPELHPKNDHQFWTLLWRGLRLNLGNLIRELCLTVLLLMLSVIPPFGLITAPLLLLIQAYFVGVGNLDYSLESFFNYRQSKSFLNQYRGLAIGNGFLFNLLALIPFVGVIIVLPLSVSAAAISVFKHTELMANPNRLIN